MARRIMQWSTVPNPACNAPPPAPTDNRDRSGNYLQGSVQDKFLENIIRGTMIGSAFGYANSLVNKQR